MAAAEKLANTRFARVALGTSITLVLLLGALALYLWLKPPDLLRVGANYAAKIVCSNVFLAGRDPEQVLHVDVQAPGLAVLHLMRVSVDRDQRLVRAGLLGFIGDGLAVARPGTGCAVVPDGDLEFALHASLNTVNTPASVTSTAPTIPGTSPIPAASSTAAASAAPAASSTAAASAAPAADWPDGNHVETRAALDRILADDTLAGPGMRAIVVVDHGRIVAERYAPGFTAATPLLGWSMTKTVVAGLVGLLVKDGRLSLDQSAGWPAAAADGREHIRLADLLAMSSGLRFNENYGAVPDLTRMLYLEPDMAAFARAQPPVHPPGANWSYSSGTANIVSRIVQDAAGGLAAAYPREKLFKPLGMDSATMETDAYGTLVGSSYMYATARDWARYGQFLAQDGIWQGREMLPRGYVAMMAEPVTASRGEYGHGFVWLWGSDALTPGKNPDTAFGIPADTFWMEGHDGQIIAVIRSRNLVVVRLGLTPVSEHYQPQPLVKALLEAAQFASH